MKLTLGETIDRPLLEELKIIIEKAELETQLVKILSDHCGEDGDNEGAVETLERIIKKAEKLNRIMEILNEK